MKNPARSLMNQLRGTTPPAPEPEFGQETSAAGTRPPSDTVSRSGADSTPVDVPRPTGDGEVAVRRITLITKPGCHLCDDARAVVEAVAAREGVGWQEIDMLGDDELVARYAEQIPVTLVDGRQHDYWRVDAERLTRALRTPLTRE